MAKHRTRIPARTPQSGWTEAHVRRLFWRAGFGATPSQLQEWARRGKTATLDHLFDSTPATLLGPAPSDYGAPIDPFNEFGHDRLWWLDRMVRSDRPLQEKMTLFWHDHFATRSQPTPLMLAQNVTMREKGLTSFPELLYAMTIDPALARFLSLTKNVAEAPNENFARELMELFTLGSGYTEQDIREAARALTGFREQRENGQTTGVYFDSSVHDNGLKTIFGATGAWGVEDVLRLCVANPAHPQFLVSRLWDFFVGKPISAAVRSRLAGAYVASGMQLRPLVRSILSRPELYLSLEDDDMVKWPAVLVAGQLRTMNSGIEVSDWNVLMASMGQTLFSPPSVAGWDWGTRWLSSNAMRARFGVANIMVAAAGPADLVPGEVGRQMTVDEHVALAVAAVGSPQVTAPTRRVLKRLATSYGMRPSYGQRVQIQRSLRHLLVSGPDNQLC
ncbi:MAG: DUF1800 domain-containing protein [Solirubrobacteraceae bacterium]